MGCHGVGCGAGRRGAGRCGAVRRCEVERLREAMGGHLKGTGNVPSSGVNMGASEYLDLGSKCVTNRLLKHTMRACT